MAKAKSLIIMALFLLLCGITTVSQAQANSEQGIRFQNAKLNGKLVAYNGDRGIYVVYGDVTVEDRGQWNMVEANKFISVQPSVDWVEDEEIKNLMGKGVTMYGSYIAYGDQTEEYFRAKKAEAAASYPQPVNENWIGFGKSIQTLNAVKFNVNTVTDFVDVLAEGRDALAGMNIERKRVEYTIPLENAQKFAQTIRYPKNTDERDRRKRMLDWWNSHWNFKWFVEKDISTYNENDRSVGGSAFFTGKLGYANCYLESVPVIRPDIENFMENARSGGGFEEESGPAVFFASIGAVRDEDWPHEIIELYASGPLFYTPQDLISGILKNDVKYQSWRLEGWSRNRAEILNGKRCWLSGSRVLVYKTDPETGETYLADHYFSVHKTLTQNEFNTMLDLQRELIGQGGF